MPRATRLHATARCPAPRCPAQESSSAGPIGAHAAARRAQLDGRTHRAAPAIREGRGTDHACKVAKTAWTGFVSCLKAAALPCVPGICKAIGKALGKEPEIVLYSPEKVGTGKSGKAEGFPFR
jgi:hypothetical protein